MPHDAIVVGAGPAGSVAAIVLARAGARVLLVDRAVFPRDKLCGDTVNPGALAILRRLGLTAADGGLPVDGMVVTGSRGARVTVRYPAGLQGRALGRRDLDLALLAAAAEAGVSIEEGILVQHALVGHAHGAGSIPSVHGVVMRGRTGRCEMPARLVIAADGRESRIARHLGLAAHPRRPRRWAIGAYFTGVLAMTTAGEMHVRPGFYIGVAPLPRGIVNACVVSADRGRLREPAGFLTEVLRSDPELGDRFGPARMISRPVTLGPLAVDCAVPGVPGLLLAGDAAGFIDPMTGDGLRFAIRGAELAALEGLRILETGDPRASRRLARRRAREFRMKWRFNRALRRFVDSPRAIRIASDATRHVAWPLRRAVSYAGDLGVV